jgi:tetratricopeptide (TPR) repeat protein
MTADRRQRRARRAAAGRPGARTEAPPPDRRRRAAAALGVLLAALTVSVYAPVAGFGFVTWDDPNYITHNPTVQQGLTPDTIAWAFTRVEHPYWQPVTWLSHLTDVSLFGLNAGAHHLVNVAFHGANTVLLFLLLTTLTGRRARSAVVAALFAVHPLHLESVAWIAERKDVLSTFFWLITTAAYVRYTRRPGVSRYLAVLCGFAIALMAKPMVVTLPFVLLLLDVWPLGRAHIGTIGAPTVSGESVTPIPWPRLMLEKVPMLALAAVSSGLAIVGQQRVATLPDLAAFSWSSRAATAALAYLDYLRQTFWPVSMAALYPLPPTVNWLRTIVAVLVLMAVSAGAIRQRRQRPYLLVGWLWYLGILVPVIGLLQVAEQARADRFTYVPLIGVLIMVAWLLSDWMASRRVPSVTRAAVACVAIGACAIAARVQLHHWRDSRALWQRVVDVSPHSYLGHNNLGTAFLELGDLPGALEHYTKATSLRPGFADPYNNIGLTLARLGRDAEAVRAYERAIALDATLVEARNNLGGALANLGRTDDAIPHFKAAVRLRPDYADAHANLGGALAVAGKFDEALIHLYEARRLNPCLPDLPNGFGIALLGLGRTDEALHQLGEAVRQQPHAPHAYSNLAQALNRLGRLPEAIHALTEAVRLDPSRPRRHYDLGVLLMQQGQRADARRAFERALALDPAYEPARAALVQLGR